MKTTEKNNLIWLDFVRGIAAILVALSHLRAMFFAGFSEQENQGIFSKIFFFITNFGHQAVIVFFVLSGFFISRSIESAYKNNRFSIRNYSINRLARLWVVLLPALVATYFWDKLGTTVVPDAFGYQGSIPFLSGTNPSLSTSLSVFFGNIFFLQDIHVHTFGSNTPLWSLSYEFWYYVLFPLLFIVFFSGKSYSLSLRVILVVAFVGLAFFVGKGVFTYFFVWLLGWGVYRLSERKFAFNKNAWIPSLLVLLFWLVMIRSSKMPSVFNDFSLAVVMAFFIYFLLPLQGNFIKKTALFISKISYTLYVVHFPLCLFLTSYFHRNIQAFTLTNFFVFLLFFGVVIAYSFVFWFLFERNTEKIKTLFLSSKK